MLVVWSWLKELVEFDREVSAEECAVALTRAGLEVEEFRRVGDGFSGVVIAEVLSKRRHPTSTMLSIVEVIDREGGEPTSVICGAPNVPDVGGRVLWARPGAIMPDGFVLGKKEIKGVLSSGMLCSESELCLGDESDGILVLDEAGCQLRLGDDAASALNTQDVVFDLCIPANRPDALGHIGVARELAALLLGRIVLPPTNIEKFSSSRKEINSMISVSVHDSARCPRYVARVIEDLRVTPSPLWMRMRLSHVGVRPRNNLVDIGNYVMYELGQPLHVFDFTKLHGAAIHVRRASPGETMVTLDKAERSLLPDDLLICDDDAPVALAGVMGGETSEVEATTTTVLLESATFDAMTVRRTAKRLGAHSDSSQRFERGVDINGVDFASRRAALLLTQLGGGAVVTGVIDCYPRVIEPEIVSMRLARCNALCGIEIPVDVVVETLGNQGLEVVSVDDEIKVRVPTSRSDIRREVDLIEEVVRMYGFDRVPATLPSTAIRPTRDPDHKAQRAHSALVAAGFCENLSYGFTSPTRIRNLGYPEGHVRNDAIAVDNPLTVEQSVMRTSLWCGLLAAVDRNHKHQVSQVRIFEQGHVFLREEENREEIREPLEMCAVLCGNSDGWLRPGVELDFFDAKGAAISVLEGIYGRSHGHTFVSNPAGSIFHPGISAAIVSPEGAKVGGVGEIHPQLRKAFDLQSRVFGFEFLLEEMNTPDDVQMTDIPRYPTITRDISILLDVHVPSSQVYEIVEKINSPLVAQLQILEDYRDPEHVPEGKKSMLWSVTYRSSERTLTDKEVDEAHDSIQEQLLQELAATFR